MVPLDIELQWVNVRQNPFKQTYSGIIQAYSKPRIALSYLEPWYIQNPDIQNQKHIHNAGMFRTPRLIRTLAYSKSRPC